MIDTSQLTLFAPASRPGKDKKAMGLTWNDLFMRGSVIHLKTSEWRAVVCIKPEDLGIENTEAVAKAMKLGSHRLAPRAAFEGIALSLWRTRQAIDYHSIPFPFIRGARYVPQKNIAALSEKLRACRLDFEREVRAFADGYAVIKANMLPVLREALFQAAHTKEAAERAFERVQDEYPTASEVSRLFRLEWELYTLQGPAKEGAEAALRDESEVVRGVIREMMGDLRDEVREKLAGVLAIIQRGGKLGERSIESAMAVLDHVDSVNILGDQVLQEQVAVLRRSLAGMRSGQDVGESAIAGLESVKRELETSLDEAVRQAEEKLTAVGKRKLSVA